MVLFYNLNFKMSRKMCKWCHKVRNGPILSPWSPNIWNYVFQSIFINNLGRFSQIWDYIIKTVFFYTIVCLISIPSSRISRNMWKWRHKLQNVKKSVGPPFTWWNEAWCISSFTTCLHLNAFQNRFASSYQKKQSLHFTTMHSVWQTVVSLSETLSPIIW